MEMDEDRSSESSWSSSVDQLDEEEIEGTSVCLFCPSLFQTYMETFKHIETVHQLDILNEFRQRKFDCIDYIKIVNFIRKEKPEAGNVFSLENIWRTPDTYMTPTINDDTLLRFDIESAFDEPVAGNAGGDGSVTGLQLKITEYTDKISELQSTVKSLRVSIRNIVDERPEKGTGKKREKHYENDSYFSSYSHFGIHQEMLSDLVRTKSYQDAIINNKPAFESRSVLDIGCGTGILSLFSATAGAKHVLAVDDSDMAFYAMAIVTENKLTQQIEVVKRRVEELPKDKKFDIIVSEWMGYFLLFEGMLDTVIDARENLLQPGGLILPNRCTLTIAGVNDMVAYQKHVYFWDNVYGYKMTSLKHECMLEAVVQVVKPENVITESCVISQIDVMKCTIEETHTVRTDFSMKVLKSGVVNSICGWFDCYFDAPGLQEKVCMSTSPFTKETHWKQTLFLLKKPIELKEGENLEGQICITRLKNNARALQIAITFRNGDKQEFYMN